MKYITAVFILLYIILIFYKIRAYLLLKERQKFRDKINCSLLEIGSFPEFGIGSYHKYYWFTDNEEKRNKIAQFYSKNCFIPYKCNNQITNGRLNLKMQTDERNVGILGLVLIFTFPNIWQLLSLPTEVDNINYELNRYLDNKTGLHSDGFKSKNEIEEFFENHEIQSIELSESHAKKFEDYLAS